MVRIYSPDPYYQGTVGVVTPAGRVEVTFRDGVAETDDPYIIEFCESAGYRIEEYDDGTLPVGDLEQPAANASQEAWADWVIATVVGVDPDVVRATKRDELRDTYGQLAA